MVDSSLQAWVDYWSSRYSPDFDVTFSSFAHRAALGGDDLEKLYNWKYRRLWPARKIRAMRQFPEPAIQDLTARAFLCADEVGALRILTVIPGLDAAGASAVLAAQAPNRYTVMDKRAIASLSALGHWDTTTHGAYASAVRWPTYLTICRSLAEDADRSLRVVDRALWQANGAAMH